MTLITPIAAARLFAINVGTLTKWRHLKVGPDFHRIGGAKKGAIRYTLADLEQFVTGSRVAVR